GISFDDKSSLPLLHLPYATYRAESYHESKDYYRFKNIRFAAPPTGGNRWKKPQSPPSMTEIQDGSVGWACHQAETSKRTQPTSEDCLFLDMYVPGKAIRGEVKDLPVLDWIYSGGYVFGSKDFVLYDSGMYVEIADNNLIYVSANHRMGAFGFLTGPTVEAEATSNVGFHDQRAALQWVQDYVHLVGGNKNEVTAWGLSSGGGSIMHHLIAKHGKSDPLFHRAILNSPAYVPVYDKDMMETSFQTFASLLGCSGSGSGKGIACLRNISEAALQNASAYTSINAPSGHFGFGPGIDNEYILDLPANELRKGNYWHNLQSVMVSHGTHEGNDFTNKSDTTLLDFDTLVNTSFPNMTAATRAELYTLYPDADGEIDRIESLISRYAVTCNTRWLAEAYAGRTWGYRPSVYPGVHGEDSFWNWWRADLTLGPSFDEITLDLDLDDDKHDQFGVANTIQGFIASFARSGSPNNFLGNDSDVTRMPQTVLGDKGLNLLDLGIFEKQVVDDEDTIKGECDWWQSSAWTG
ncbi:alpha/beta-hydrolase, partial [Saccharata proteae CBS 121410]